MDARRSSLKDVLNEGLKVILEIRSIKKFLAFFFRGVRLLFKHALPSRATHYRNDDEYLDHDVSLSKGYQIPAEEIASAERGRVAARFDARRLWIRCPISLPLNGETPDH